MNSRIKSIADQAEQLPAADRVRLVEHLLATLDKPDPEVDQAWTEESERRLDMYLRGEIAAIDAADVLAKHVKP
jgi:putative addiction module component (TIGR02574 family)